MDHQNIARVLDTGTTNDGRPYFVMELVDGIPITQYCDDNTLSVDERLKPVCFRVQSGATRSPERNHSSRSETV